MRPAESSELGRNASTSIQCLQEQIGSDESVGIRRTNVSMKMQQERLTYSQVLGLSSGKGSQDNHQQVMQLSQSQRLPTEGSALDLRSSKEQMKG